MRCDGPMRAGSVLIQTLLLASLLGVSELRSQDRYHDIVEHILAEWKHADVVCLGEGHGRLYDSELRIALVRHPGFPRIVRAIVVEFANPIHQELLDRFSLDTAAMSRRDLSVVWRDASTGIDVWESPIYEEFFRAVQAVNKRLDRPNRVRLIAGDTRIPWDEIRTPEQLLPLMNRGDDINKVIATQLLDQHIKGLAIYGSGHCATYEDEEGEGGFPARLANHYGYARARMWGIGPFTAKARPIFGLGETPTYVVLSGQAAASQRAEGVFGRIGSTLPARQVFDAAVYHGNVTDSIVWTDTVTLNREYGKILQHRDSLRRAAIRLRSGQR